MHFSDLRFALSRSICLPCEGSRESNCFFQALQKFRGIGSDSSADSHEFHDVDSPLTALIFGDEGLRSTKALGELMLRQVSSLARLDHQFAEDGLFRGMDGFVEFARASCHRRGRLIRTSDYPKTGYILTLLLYCLCFQWTSPPQEANCRHGQFGGQTGGANT